jgi:hypothetical protein
VYPGVNFPTLTAGYGFNTRKNPIDLNQRMLFSPRLDSLGNPTALLDTTILPSKADSLNYANEITNRLFFAANYDFNLLARQSFNATLSIANKTDHTFNLRNQENLNAAVALTTIYKIPMQTTIGFIYSHNATYTALQDSITKRYLTTTSKQTFDYQTVSFNVRYRLLNERLNLLATVAPSFGDFKRTLFQGGIDFQIMDGHYLVGQIDVIQYPEKGNDQIASLVYRFNF